MIPANLYEIVFLYSVILLTVLSWIKVGKSYNIIARGSNNFILAALLSLVYAVWLGGRPLYTRFFGDTIMYAHSFALFKAGLMPAGENEWVWSSILKFCAEYSDATGFLTFVDIAYFGFTLWACKRFTSNNVLVSLLFFMGSLSFYSYGINGIRNGLACSMVLLALSYLQGNLKDKIIAGVLSFLAINIHTTAALPIAMGVISLLFIKSFKWAYFFWVASIILSLVAGTAISGMFAAFGFDDRLTYITAELEDGAFSRTGFRWDFLIYSMMPILLGYYVVIRRGIRNRTYELLLNTYTLSNAFWVMVIRANFSNRFAYLSWFMYPIVLAYPLLKLNVWGPVQGDRLKLIMFAHVGFTWFMTTIYW